MDMTEKEKEVLIEDQRKSRERYLVCKQFGKVQLATAAKSHKNKLNLTMQLMGLPYQFMDHVDKRIPGLSSKIGRKYIENIIMEAPVISVLPGKPAYLPGTKKKAAATNALVKAAQGDIKDLVKFQSDDQALQKLYDWQTDYGNTMQYVNMLNNATAAFLNLGSAENMGYKINGELVNFEDFDWKNYKWNGKKYSSMTTKILKQTSLKTKKKVKQALSAASSGYSKTINMAIKIINKKKKKTKTEKKVLKKLKSQKKSLKSMKVNLFDQCAALDEKIRIQAEELSRQSNYIQFYVDPSSSNGDINLSNSTQASAFKQAFDTASGAVKDVAFLASSGGADPKGLQKLGDEAITALGDALGSAVGNVNQSAGSLISRLGMAGSTVIRGENIMMPDIWTGSDNQKSYSVTMKFKALYGNRMSLYTDVLVPLNFWLALSFPRATTANSYASPPLLKCYQQGQWTCSLGIVSSLSVTKMEAADTRNMDGLPQEISVTVNITDLYSDMALSPANNPALFLANSSLIEFIATTCGLDLLESQLKTKMKLYWKTGINFAKNTPNTVMGSITDKTDAWIVKHFTGL